MKKIIKVKMVCNLCGKVKNLPYAQAQQRLSNKVYHCSLKCFQKSKIKKCIICSMEFSPRKHGKRGEQKLCSKKCRIKYTSKLRIGKKFSNYPKGKNHHRWKGGKNKNAQGYIMVGSPLTGFKAEHRVKMEKKLNRKLATYEYVHHKNGNKSDNRLNNLEIVYAKKHYGTIRCPHCLKKFKIK